MLISANALLALRKADLRFVQNIIMGGRLLLLSPLAFLGSLGIFYSVGLAYIIATAFALIIIKSNIAPTFKIDWNFVRKTLNFSLMNYLASIFQYVPTLAMPIIIINIIGPEDAAFYYIAFAIGNLVLIIPDAMSYSFFVEGSYGINLRKGAKKTIIATSIILIPTIIAILLFGDFLLGFFGEHYLDAFNLLRIIAISSLFVSIYNLFISLQNIRLQVRELVIINMLRFVFLLGFSFIFLTWFGVIGAGYAWLVTYIILGIVIGAFAWKKGWI